MLATPFGVDDLHMLVGLGVRAVKVASPDITNFPLLEAVRQTRLPVILSTGAATMPEVAEAAAFLAGGSAEAAPADRGPAPAAASSVAAGLTPAGGLALLHCVSSYPTPLGQANLRCIAALEAAFGLPAGFSDHTVEVGTGEPGRGGRGVRPGEAFHPGPHPERPGPGRQPYARGTDRVHRPRQGRPARASG